MLDYHDAVLISVEVDWRHGMAEIQVNLCADEARAVSIVVTGLLELRVNRRFPWGPSSSVNNVRQSSADDGEGQLEIEMQSGDVLIALGREIREDEISTT